MPLSENELIVKKSTKFSKYQSSVANDENGENINVFDASFGGIIRKGQLGWRAKGSYFEVCSLKTGQKLSNYCFDSNLGCRNCIVTCVGEIDIPILNESLLAIGVQYGDNSGSIVAVFSIQESRILRCIELNEKITTCQFISSVISKRTILNIMDECLAIGTDTGKVILLDLNLDKCENDFLQNQGDTIDSVSFVRCHLVNYDLELLHMRQSYSTCKQEKTANFGILLESLENAGLVLCLKAVIPNLSLIAGFEDGRLVIYDLCDLRLYHVTLSDSVSPLVKLSYMEPPDDPRPCIYIWAFHENAKGSVAIMHLLMYEKRSIEDDNVCLFENFQSSSVCLILPTYETNSLPVVCQALTKSASNGDEEITSICLLSWKTQDHSQILVFDINQWYKEEMPTEDDWRKNLNYLAAFKIKHSKPLDIFIDSNTVALFNSIQRPEEHFYPNSISFDCAVLQSDGSYCLHWPGLQNVTIQLLNSLGPMALLEPHNIFNETLRSYLLPQFCESTYNSTFSKSNQREILLSIAIEYNCTNLLWKCAKSWSDGSHMGKNSTDGLTLSTMTEWIWKRALNIKNRCNVLCKNLFEYSGLPLDRRENKELSCLSRQLKLLSDLLNSILIKWNSNMPTNVLQKLENQYKSLRAASEYQEILLWLLNIGLLPESFNNLSQHHLNLVPYPYNELRNFYQLKRAKFAELNDKFISKRTKSCRMLFIDSFIEHECNPAVLSDHWLESGGNGLYPPPSLQAMLRAILIPDVSFEKKCALFLYFFLDLSMTIKEERYRDIVENLIKFPTVFKLTASMIKTVQAFWSLDHGNFQIAMEEIISPFYCEQKLTQWQLELLIETFLAHKQPNFALRILQARKSPLSPVLEMNTLLSNNLICEAFHFARKKSDADIMSLFFTGCLCMGKYNVFRDLALTEEEGEVVIEILKNHRTIFGESLHLIYLLEKSKYIEAISYLEELSKSRSNNAQTDIDTPSLILSAYNLTMTPVTKIFVDTYYKIQNRIKDKEVHNASPYPLSCQLIKKNANHLLGGVYHSTALGTHFATYYWDNKSMNDNRLRDSENAPFVRKPQLEMFDECKHRENITYPEEFQIVEKRRKNNESLDLDCDSTNLLENPIKRRKINQTTDAILLPQRQTTAKSINSSLLTKFKFRTIESGISDQQTTPLQSNNRNSLTDNTTAKHLYSLNTPIIKNTIDSRNSARSSITQSENNLNIHSILKVKPLNRRSPVNSDNEENAIRQVTPQYSLQDSNEDEEKLIRFKLPKAVGNENDRLEMNVSDYKIEKPLQYSEGPSKRKSLHSLNSSVMSTTTIDSADFFSPTSSLNNSIYMETTENTITETINENKANDDTIEKLAIRRNVLGAQPRKPLRSVSRSRSSSRSNSITSQNVISRSNTPERNVKVDQILESENENENDQTTASKTIDQNLPDENSKNNKQLKTIPENINDLTKINTSNFKPFISSSKVEQSESKFIEEKSKEVTKFLEKSTVIGGVTFMETTTMITRSKVSKTPTSFNQDEQLHVDNSAMDTTIEMSGSDVTTFGLPDQLFSDNSDLNVSENVFGDTNHIVSGALTIENEYKNEDNSCNEDVSTIVEINEINKNSAEIILPVQLKSSEITTQDEPIDLDAIEEEFCFSNANAGSSCHSEQNVSEACENKEQEEDVQRKETYNAREIFDLDTSRGSNESVVIEPTKETEQFSANSNQPIETNADDDGDVICLTSSSSDNEMSTTEGEENDSEEEPEENDDSDIETPYASLSVSDFSLETSSSEGDQSQLLYGSLDTNEVITTTETDTNNVFDSTKIIESEVGTAITILSDVYTISSTVENISISSKITEIPDAIELSSEIVSSIEISDVIGDSDVSKVDITLSQTETENTKTESIEQIDSDSVIDLSTNPPNDKAELSIEQIDSASVIDLSKNLPNDKTEPKSIEPQLLSTNMETDSVITISSSSTAKRVPRSASEPPRDNTNEAWTPSKIRKRRPSNVLDKIEENIVFDSPSSRTRLQTRLNSNDSLTGTPTQKRLSLSQQDVILENPNEKTTKPKSKRRSSTADVGPEITQSTSRKMRAQSMTMDIKSPAKNIRRRSQTIFNQEISSPLTPTNNLASSSPNISSLLSSSQTPNKRSKKSASVTPNKRKTGRLSTTKELSPVPDEDQQEDKKEDRQEVDLSSFRRLTRTQMAIMKKSAAYAAGTHQHFVENKSNPQTTSPTKSDDAESTSSKISFSSNRSVNRRVTRSSRASNMDENDFTDSASLSSTSQVKQRKRKMSHREDDGWRSQSPQTVLLSIAEKFNSGGDVSSDSDSNTSSNISGRKKSTRGRGRPRKNKP